MGFDRWQLGASHIPFHERYIRVRRDELHSPGGETTDYVYLEDNTPGTVVILALTEEGRIPLVYQYRYPIHTYQYNLPGGIIDPGETPLEAAVRELREETGITADTWTFAGGYHPFGSHHTRKAHLFVAKGLHFGEQQLDPYEDIEVKLFSLEEIMRKIQADEMTDMELMAGVYMAQVKGLMEKE